MPTMKMTYKDFGQATNVDSCNKHCYNICLKIQFMNSTCATKQHF